ncbi:MAG: type II toxin-antitoxin system CcdA family antitoxin [Burkholderiales bacterium]|nr:type II toxin-antitoxin system CcdA family antitoxin [Burkholderiales bacterium]
MSAAFRPLLDDGAAKKSTNLSLPDTLVDEAKRLGINLSRAAARGLADEIAEKRAAQWLEENRAAISDWNDYVAEHGLPLARFRQF